MNTIILKKLDSELYDRSRQYFTHARKLYCYYLDEPAKLFECTRDGEPAWEVLKNYEKTETEKTLICKPGNK